MAKQLRPDALPYCLWNYSENVGPLDITLNFGPVGPTGQFSAYPDCDIDYHEKLEDARKRTVCPVCDRPIRWPPRYVVRKESYPTNPPRLAGWIVWDTVDKKFVSAHRPEAEADAVKECEALNAGAARG